MPHFLFYANLKGAFYYLKIELRLNVIYNWDSELRDVKIELRLSYWPKVMSSYLSMYRTDKYIDCQG